MSERAPLDEQDLDLTLARVARANEAHEEAFRERPGATIRAENIEDLSIIPDAEPPPVPGSAKKATPPEPPSAPALRRPPAGSALLVLGETIGQGGMGVVHQAVQSTLDRPVAVKGLKSDFQHERAIAMMLQEAYIMGHLEHPNILPVYDLQWNERALPQLVLKKVEGTEWQALMRDPATVKARFGESDLLEWNLRVLMQVCNAVHFAHSRGIIHRDLKPENIMIGEFGEVYVMDWGLALSLRDDGSGRLPLARKADQLAGTPHYMAPEMTGGQAHLIGERTDVYLLGAMLYEVVVGRAPHTGNTMPELLACVLRSSPDFPAEAPDELCRIVREAMDRDPGWRHESAESLRLSINRFLQHRGSHRLAAQASRNLARLRDEIAEATTIRESLPPGGAVGAVVSEAERARATRIHDTFGEVRYGYRQALEIWEGNDAAADGLDAALRTMIDYELSRGNPHGAALLVSSLEDAEPELGERVAAAVERKDRQTEALERLGRQLDPRTRRRDRAISAAVLGVLWTLTPLLAPYVLQVDTVGGATHAANLAFLGAGLVVLIAWRFLGREELTHSAISRRLLSGAMVAIGAACALEIAGALLGLSVEQSQVLWFMVFFVVCAMLAVAVERYLAVAAAGFLVALLISARFPEHRLQVMAGSNFLLMLNLLFAWAPRRALRRRAD